MHRSTLAHAPFCFFARPFRRLSLLALWMALFSVEARAADWYVNAAVCPAAGNGSQASPFCRVSSALAVAAAGDTIWITQGYYPENLVITRSVHLRGLGNPTSTILDGSNNGTSLLRITGGGTVTLTQLCLQRGYFASTSGTGAGGIDLTGGDLTCTDVVIRDCGCGTWLGRDGFAGGIGARASRVRLVRTQLQRCRSYTTHGGGVRLTSGSSLEMIGSVLMNCEADQFGAGVYAEGTSITVRDSTFTSNRAGLQSGAWGEGAGVYLQGGSGIFDRVTFSGQAAYFNQARTPSYGGAVCARGVSDLRISSCIFHGCSATNGSAVFVGGSSTPMEISHSTFHFNLSFGSRGGVCSTIGGGVVTHCISSGNIDDRILGATVSYSCVAGGQTGTGNISADPLFVNATAGDFRLSPGSPCIDAGNPQVYSAGLDRRGFPRTLDGDLNLSLVPDPGAHEYGNAELFVSSPARPGGDCYLTVGGRYGLVYVRFLSTGFRERALDPYGSLFADLAGFSVPYLNMGVIAESRRYLLPIETPRQLDLHIQDLAIDPVTFAGNFSNPVVLQIR